MDEIEEHAFRRGFTHGYMMALDNIQAGHGYLAMNDFFNEKLLRWREENYTRPVMPPEIEDRF